MENQIVLSAAEKELIEINRQKVELATQERSARKKKADEDKIENGKKSVLRIKVDAAKHSVAVNEYFDKLNKKYPGLYRIDVKQVTKTIEEYNFYHSSLENKPANLVNGREILFTEDVISDYSCIVRVSDEKYKIAVKEHFVSGSVFYGFRNKGFKMYVVGTYGNDRALSSVDTAHKNIQDHIDSTIRITDSKNTEETGWSMLESKVKALHPEAVEVNKQDKFVTLPGSARGYYKKLVHASFTNGLVVSYAFRYFKRDTEMVFEVTVHNINTNKLDKANVINVLKNL